MISRGLDQNGDWLYGKGLNDYRVNKLAVEQNIQTRLSSFTNDCFFASSSGLDWFNLLGTNQKLALTLQASAIILNTENVLSIISLDVITDPDRNIRLIYSVNTPYGVITSTVLQNIETVGLLLTEDGDTLTTEDGDPLAQEVGNSLTENPMTDEDGNQLTDEDGNVVITEQ